MVSRMAGRAEDVSLGRRLLAFAVLMIFEFFYGWCWNTVDVLRPQIRESLGLTLTQAGSAYTAQSLGALAGAVVLGQVADRAGRRLTLFGVVTGYGVFAAIGAFVPSYGLLLAQRFGLGFFLGAIFPVLIGLYMGLFPGGWRGKLASLGQGTYNLSVVALGWALALPVAQSDWRLILLAGAIPPILLCPLLLICVPDDRRVRPWDDGGTAPPAAARFPIAQLFVPPLLRPTILLFLLVGLNFFGYQAFAGWVTTYLKEIRGFGPQLVGPIVAFQFVGAAVGGFFWGWFSDRYGRRVSGIGFFGGAAAVLCYLLIPASSEAYRWIGAVWGFMITASVAWGPWISIMFPVHLRSTAMSIFNWGRLISMTAPLITGAMAGSFGLGAAMFLSAAAFALGGVVWLMIPERISGRDTTNGPLPVAEPA